MLLEFTVQNYRSIRDPQTLSMIATTKDEKPSASAITLTAHGLEGTRALPMTAIYGANASGKTNVLKAMRFMKHFVQSSARSVEAEEPTGVEPFLFDGESRHSPSTFDVALVLDDVRYDYGFSLDGSRVLREYLYAYPKGRKQAWFERNHEDAESGAAEWSFSRAHFKMDREITRLVRPNALLLSVGTQLNNEQLATVYKWFSRDLHFLNLSGKDNLAPTVTGRMIEKDATFEEEVVRLLAAADIPVVGAEIKTSPFDLKSISGSARSLMNLILPEKEAGADGLRTMQIRLIHECEDGHREALDLEDESAGTHRMFSLAGPWLDTLQNGYTLMVDELDTSLHPDLARALLRLVARDTTNPRHAQIVFTTHNVQLLDRDVLRRDEVWFTTRGSCGSTELYPLTEFKPRPTEALARGYLAGRYGALPQLSDELRELL